MVSKRLRKLREKINRREKSKRADRRAKSRRIEKGDPDSATEAAQVKAKQAKQEAEMTADEARKLSRDAKTLLATELGVSRSESESIISEGASLLSEAGDRVDQLDIDDDGDTDILSSFDPIVGDEGGGSSAGISAKSDGNSSDSSAGIGAKDAGDDSDTGPGDFGGLEPVFDPFNEEL